MSKTRPAAPKAATHFERVPLEVVKEITKVDPPATEARGRRPLAEPRPAKKKAAAPVASRVPARKGR